MYDAKDCLRNIKRMHRPSIVDQVTRKKCEKFKTESKRYNAIYEEITKCSSQEKDNLEILLKCEKGASERLKEFLGIFPMFFSVVSIFVSIFSAITKQANDMVLQNYVTFIICIGVSVNIAILIYAIVYNMSSRNLDKTSYLLGVLEKVREYGPKGSKTK